MDRRVEARDGGIAWRRVAARSRCLLLAACCTDLVHGGAQPQMLTERTAPNQREKLEERRAQG